MYFVGVSGVGELLVVELDLAAEQVLGVVVSDQYLLVIMTVLGIRPLREVLCRVDLGVCLHYLAVELMRRLRPRAYCRICAKQKPRNLI